MSLIDDMMVDCVMMDKQTQSDGLGGISTLWVDGTKFKAAITKNNSVQTKIAEKQDVAENYSVTVEKGTLLKFHDVFKRLSDDYVFRVTSNIHDSETPKRASFQIGQVSAERWDLT